MKNQKGTVRWFDNRSGEGFIRVGEKSIYVHWSAMVPEGSTASLNPKSIWYVLFGGQEVMVDVIEDSHYTQVSKVY